MKRMSTFLFAALVALTFSIGLADQAWAAAATKDRNTLIKVSMDLKTYPVAASTTIYKGTMVALNTSGYAVPAADTASFLVVGVADAKVDNSTGAAGDLTVKVRTGVALLSATSITQAMVGTMMYVVDDQNFDDTTGTNAIPAGVLVEYVSSTSGWVMFGAPANPAMGNLMLGAGVGYRVARGSGTLSNGVLAVSTGLNAITSCTVTLRKAATPGTDPVIFTVDPVSTSLWVYAWKFTNSSTTTLIASTNSSEAIDWICVGK